jgi:hypothetical protein
MDGRRMLHPVINQIGLTPKMKLLKKKKRLRFDNSPYGQIIPEVKKKYSKHHLSLDDCWFNGSFRRCNTRGIQETSIRNFTSRTTPFL